MGSEQRVSGVSDAGSREPGASADIFAAAETSNVRRLVPAILGLLYDHEQPMTEDYITDFLAQFPSRHTRLALCALEHRGRVKRVPGMGWVITDAGVDRLAEFQEHANETRRLGAAKEKEIS